MRSWPGLSSKDFMPDLILKLAHSFRRRNIGSVVPSPTGLPSKRGPSLGSFSRADRGIGGVRHVAPPTWLVSMIGVYSVSWWLYWRISLFQVSADAERKIGPDMTRKPYRPGKHEGLSAEGTEKQVGHQAVKGTLCAHGLVHLAERCFSPRFLGPWYRS